MEVGELPSPFWYLESLEKIGGIRKF